MSKLYCKINSYKTLQYNAVHLHREYRTILSIYQLFWMLKIK